MPYGSQTSYYEIPYYEISHKIRYVLRYSPFSLVRCFLCCSPLLMNLALYLLSWIGLDYIQK